MRAKLVDYLTNVAKDAREYWGETLYIDFALAIAKADSWEQVQKELQELSYIVLGGSPMSEDSLISVIAQLIKENELCAQHGEDIIGVLTKCGATRHVNVVELAIEVDKRLAEGKCHLCMGLDPHCRKLRT